MFQYVFIHLLVLIKIILLNHKKDLIFQEGEMLFLLFSICLLFSATYLNHIILHTYPWNKLISVIDSEMHSDNWVTVLPFKKSSYRTSLAVQ